jgi:1-aminocyclopropane-1-carboxylate deaminase
MDKTGISIERISAFFATELEVDVLRLDKIHPVISGNKWFKLRYYIEDAKAQNKKTIVTFGGAWSNHIIATAAAGKLHGLKTIGIIRGEKPLELSTTLQQAEEAGMKLVFVSREDYSKKIIPPGNEGYIINEGGYGNLGAEGASTILDHCPNDFTHYCCAAGTGTMAAGLANRVSKVVAVSVLKNNHSLEREIATLLRDSAIAPAIIHDYHFDGYAKYQPELLQFMNDLYRHTGIPTDFVYTAKLFYAVRDLISKSFFPTGSRILLIHSGGLQGNLSLRKGTLMF